MLTDIKFVTLETGWGGSEYFCVGNDWYDLRTFCPPDKSVESMALALIALEHLPVSADSVSSAKHEYLNISTMGGETIPTGVNMIEDKGYVFRTKAGWDERRRLIDLALAKDGTC